MMSFKSAELLYYVSLYDDGGSSHLGVDYACIPMCEME